MMAVVGAVIFVSRWNNNRRANMEYSQLEEDVNPSVIATDAPDEVPDELPDELPDTHQESDDSGLFDDKEESDDFQGEIPVKEIDWEALHEKNEDIYAWIFVPDTKVDYPVLQDPDDPAYYLNHNIDGSKGLPGCIYTENYNKKDFSDPNTVIYGHNMKNGTMFASLHSLEKTELTKEDHYFYIYTEDSTYTYLIFAVYEFPARHLLLNYDLENEYVYEQYQQDILNGFETRPGGVNNIREDIELDSDDRMVTLSTCVRDGNKSYRFLVAGKLMAVE